MPLAATTCQTVKKTTRDNSGSAARVSRPRHRPEGVTEAGEPSCGSSGAISTKTDTSCQLTGRQAGTQYFRARRSKVDSRSEVVKCKSILQRGDSRIDLLTGVFGVQKKPDPGSTFRHDRMRERVGVDTGIEKSDGHGCRAQVIAYDDGHDGSALREPQIESAFHGLAVKIPRVGLQARYAVRFGKQYLQGLQRGANHGWSRPSRVQTQSRCGIT